MFYHVFFCALGATRLELCANLLEGGTTPSLGRCILILISTCINRFYAINYFIDQSENVFLVSLRRKASVVSYMRNKL